MNNQEYGNNPEKEIIEINESYLEHGAHYSVEPEVSKPYDISLMTGNNSTNNNQGSDKK